MGSRNECRSGECVKLIRTWEFSGSHYNYFWKKSALSPSCENSDTPFLVFPCSRCHTTSLLACVRVYVFFFLAFFLLCTVIWCLICFAETTCQHDFGMRVSSPDVVHGCVLLAAQAFRARCSSFFSPHPAASSVLSAARLPGSLRPLSLPRSAVLVFSGPACLSNSKYPCCLTQIHLSSWPSTQRRAAVCARAREKSVFSSDPPPSV